MKIKNIKDFKIFYMHLRMKFKAGDRLQVKGFAIFGDCLGVFKDGRVLFSDDETGEIRDYSPDKVLKSYEK